MNIRLPLQKLYSFCCESYLGIKTTGLVAPTVEWGVHYTPLPYQVIYRMLDRMCLQSNDVLVDIGCGKGRVLCCAARLPLKRVVGIEVNADLVNLAAVNARNLRGKKSNIETLELPAQDYDYADTTAVYLYNPFDRPIMDLVFAKLDRSFKQTPRNIRVAYANCVHEETLHSLGWLKKQEEWPASKFPGFGCPISFWSSEN